MTGFARIILILTVTLAFAVAGLSQDPSTRRDLKTREKGASEPSPAEVQKKPNSPFYPISSWMGKRFIFLSKPKMTPSDTYEDFVGAVNCSKYAGRTAKVVWIGEFSGRVHVEFEMEDTGQRVRARTIPHKESISGIALVEDLDQARAHWVGQTLWCKEMFLSSYDGQTDNLKTIKLKKYSPVKVIDVAVGWGEERPVRFILQTAAGEQGFLDINLSGTNVYPSARDLFRFENVFLVEDPRKTYKWPPRIWSAIENNQVVTGMTAEQVRLSWGEPEKINKPASVSATSEQWVYDGGRILNFRNGTLASFQK